MKVSFLTGNIIDIPADGLVCSGNINLNMSGGVSGELLSRGGQSLQVELHKFLEKNGQKYVDPGFTIDIGSVFNFKCVVYSVAIDAWYESSFSLVSSTLTSALEIIEQRNCKTVNIPALATGYGKLKKPEFGKALKHCFESRKWKFKQINIVEKNIDGRNQIKEGYD